MTWKPVLLTTGKKPPLVKASIKDDMLKLQISPEIAQAVGLIPNTNFSAYVGLDVEAGQVKVTPGDGNGRVLGAPSAPTVYIPSEATWEKIDDPTKCDFAIIENDENREKALVVNMPWFTGKVPEILQGNQKLSATQAANMIRQYERGVSRRRLAEFYGVVEATVAAYTNKPETVRAHNDAVIAAKAARENGGLLVTSDAGTATPAGLVPVVCPPRKASGLRKSR